MIMTNCELAHTSYWTCQHKVVVDFHIILQSFRAKQFHPVIVVILVAVWPRESS